MENNTDHSIIF